MSDVLTFIIRWSHTGRFSKSGLLSVALARHLLFLLLLLVLPFTFFSFIPFFGFLTPSFLLFAHFLPSVSLSWPRPRIVVVAVCFCARAFSCFVKATNEAYFADHSFCSRLTYPLTAGQCECAAAPFSSLAFALGSFHKSSILNSLKFMSVYMRWWRPCIIIFIRAAILQLFLRSKADWKVIFAYCEYTSLIIYKFLHKLFICIYRLNHVDLLFKPEVAGMKSHFYEPNQYKYIKCFSLHLISTASFETTSFHNMVLILFILILRNSRTQNA